MKGADTMNKQDKEEHQIKRIKNILSYWASRQKEKGLQFTTSLPKGARGTTEQDEVLISGRKFFLIYTQVGQAIWTKVLLQEQGAGRVFFLFLESPVKSQESRVKRQESKAPVKRPSPNPRHTPCNSAGNSLQGPGTFQVDSQ